MNNLVVCEKRDITTAGVYLKGGFHLVLQEIMKVDMEPAGDHGKKRFRRNHRKLPKNEWWIKFGCCLSMYPKTLIPTGAAFARIHGESKTS